MLHKIFDKDFVAIRKNQFLLTLNKLAYIGMFILEISEALMYEFRYNYIKNKYGNDSRLLFTELTVFLYEIKTEDIYEDVSNDKKSLTLVIIQLSQNIIIIQIN